MWGSVTRTAKPSHLVCGGFVWSGAAPARPPARSRVFARGSNRVCDGEGVSAALGGDVVHVRRVSGCRGTCIRCGVLVLATIGSGPIGRAPLVGGVAASLAANGGSAPTVVSPLSVCGPPVCHPRGEVSAPSVVFAQPAGLPCVVDVMTAVPMRPSHVGDSPAVGPRPGRGAFARMTTPAGLSHSSGRKDASPHGVSRSDGARVPSRDGDFRVMTDGRRR